MEFLLKSFNDWLTLWCGAAEWDLWDGLSAVGAVAKGPRAYARG
jgi:hypothetical protein